MPSHQCVTEENFDRAARRGVSSRMSQEELQNIKEKLIGQPVWEQDLSSEELKQGGFTWGEYVAWSCLKAW